MKTPLLLGLAACAAVLAVPAFAQDLKVDPAEHDAALDLLKKGIAFRTVIPGDQVKPYAEYLKSVLVKGGYKPDEVKIEPLLGTAILVARYPGTDPSKKPIVVIDHMDVVEAKPADWTRDPFTPVVENGYVFGRGAIDDKFDVSMVITVLAKLRHEGWKPGRDVILALSGDEETLQQTARKFAGDLKNAELVLNGDAGGGELSEDGKPLGYGIQAAEKTYADFQIVVTNPGGHSSRPGKTNAIYQLSHDLGRLEAYRFPVMTSEITMAGFKATAPVLPGPVGDALRRYVANPKDQAAIDVLSADPDFVGQLRTTCVATMIEGGHATNALPQKVTANVNCRIFPGVSSDSVRATIAQVIADPQAKIERANDGAIDAGASPLRPDVLAAVTKAVHARYPGLPIVPNMSAGATDSMFFRALGVPAYGVGGAFMKGSDDFAHGLNERVPIASIDGSLFQWESVLKDLAK
ncbi:M20/M25/M40 family metallo-hydrolase [Phenylobacterium sp.]|uniref:M20/M25/M40 family metallo-hydrolase n=1 Tax=Phenylobacterium sp. TaxID=1871053 RepID=UPI0025E99183|nr:M20/M25/M40 family metallo-hydrolase [Phenylobacterium sp.]